jgi:hypothetical protein
MRTITLFIILLCGSSHHLFGAEKLGPNASFQKLIDGATRVVVRHGGDILKGSKRFTPKGTLEELVYFEVKDQAEIKKLAKNIVFKKGVVENFCLCLGHPGIDWYVGDKRVAITAWKHGFGIMREGKIMYFTDDSKVWVRKWLLARGIKEDKLK